MSMTRIRSTKVSFIFNAEFIWTLMPLSRALVTCLSTEMTMFRKLVCDLSKVMFLFQLSVKVANHIVFRFSVFGSTNATCLGQNSGATFETTKGMLDNVLISCDI